MTNKLESLTISFTKRNARLRGPSSSENWNDSIEELSRDLLTIYNQWNNSLISLVQLLPDGTVDTNIDAYTNGLDGRTLPVNSGSSATQATNYFNISKSRANTVYEQFQNLYTYIDTRINTVQDQVENQPLAAVDIPIADANDQFTSSDVENALQEIMNLVVTTGTSHSVLSNLSADDHSQYLPRTGVRAMTGPLQMGGQDITSDGSSNLNGFGYHVTNLSAGTNNLLASDSNGFYHNSGLSSTAICQLPSSASIGTRYMFMIIEPFEVRILPPSGESIYAFGDITTPAGYIYSSTDSTSVELVKLTSTRWFITQANPVAIGGSWSIV